MPAPNERSPTPFPDIPSFAAQEAELSPAEAVTPSPPFLSVYEMEGFDEDGIRRPVWRLINHTTLFRLLLAQE
jgi:hypothetical protein